MNTNEFIKRANSIKRITKKYNAKLIINDRVDVCLACDADGVHLGQDDMPCYIAKKILRDKIIGVTVTNEAEAKKAIMDGAEYLGVGAMYKSKLKPDAKLVSFEELHKIRKISNIPVVVIGGINKNTIPNFKGMGIDGYAMVKSIIAQQDIIESTKELIRIINKNINE